MAGEIEPVQQDEYQWRQAEDGRWLPPKRQERLIDFLVTPKSLRPYPSQEQFLKAESIPYETAVRWKRDPRFRNEMWRRAKEHLVDPETVGQIFAYITEVALDTEKSDNVRYKFMRTWLELVGEIGGQNDRPWMHILHAAPQEMSEAELERRLEELERERNTIDAEVVE